MIRPTRAAPAVRAATGDRSRPVSRHGPSRPCDAARPQGSRGLPQAVSARLPQAVSTYGWRIYALPILVVLTVLAVLDAARSPLASDQAGTSGSDGEALIPNPLGGPGFAAAKESAELPGGGPFTVRGAGTWRVVPGAGAPFGTGRLFTYTVEIEDGVELEGGPTGFATTVDSTLRNPKSWIGSGRYQFQRVDDSRAATLRISLTSQETTRRLCGFQIPFDASCWRPEDHRVVINTARWARGAVAFQGNVVQYQQYAINHEVGHGLGFGHIACDGPGRLAPVMMQQTWGVADDYLAALNTDHVTADGLVCQPNAWPFPTVD
ncbi:MAG: DUF3152 domain-containing protein [Pseudonocardiales bacterium]|nr:DUF3152 domain-containing protein [Pseudonocardiales bacterium]MBV9031556.1 DUF3152 domain-containing protein [Pseudonocardiales bacterium]MBW0009476.1 DUF3152 domain-containing protein [Pseudonocardiales bacterium]